MYERKHVMQTMDEISPTFTSVHNFCENLV